MYPNQPSNIPSVRKGPVVVCNPLAHPELGAWNYQLAVIHHGQILLGLSNYPSDSSDPTAGVSAKRNKEGGTAEHKDQIANHTTCLGRSKKGVATSR